VSSKGVVGRESLEPRLGLFVDFGAGELAALRSLNHSPLSGRGLG
jgi:hypothetical protein